MNGVHDMGGMHGMGTIRPEAREPAFHATWEGRVYALSRVLRARGGQWNLDAFRHGIERLPPADYLRMSYYERWFAWLLGKLVATGDASQAEVDSGQVAAASPRATPFVTKQNVSAMIARRASSHRAVPVVARFRTGKRVPARTTNPPGHTRLPLYVREKAELILRARGVGLFPASTAISPGENPNTCIPCVSAVANSGALR